MQGAWVESRLRLSAHDLAVALGIETDLVRPVPLAAFEGRRAELERYFGERLAVAAQGAPCPLRAVSLDGAGLPENLLVVTRHECPAPVSRLGVGYGLFFDLDPTHRAVGGVLLAGRDEPFVFDRSLTRLDLDVVVASDWAPRFRRLFALGVEHVLTGYDHLLFLLALLLAAARFWPTVKIVTAFTVAHSLTLALAWSGAVALPPRLVETAIAVTVAYVAAENVIGRAGGHRWLLAGGFGLVHGLGFYGALRESGLAGGGVVTTLLAFNLGVEAGQVALVALACGLLLWWAGRPWYRAFSRAGSAAILVVAAWWVLQRTTGP